MTDRRVRAARSFAAIVTLALTAGACGAPRLPPPEYVAQPKSALRPAPFPPPPARAEWVPDAPRDSGAVWIDGEWTWQGRRWAWRPGRWVRPPANARYSPWTTVRDARGNVYVAEGRWRDGAGRVVADPPPLAVGRSSGGVVVTADGADVEAGPDAPAPGSSNQGAARPPAR
jgi:hypothetical protein